MARPLPTELRGRVFTLDGAQQHGISLGTLRGPRITTVVTGVYRFTDTELTPELAVEAARMVLPPDAILCRTSALAWRGLSLRPLFPLHFATNLGRRSRHPAIRLHRHDGALSPHEARGIPITGPDRTFVGCGTELTLPELVATGDWLIAKVDVVNDDGTFLGRGDLVYEEWRVVVEYDGWYHERDSAQRQRDILRREQLEAAGWRVVVLTSADAPQAAAWRVYNAIRGRGFNGRAPRFQFARFGRWMQPSAR